MSNQQFLPGELRRKQVNWGIFIVAIISVTKHMEFGAFRSGALLQDTRGIQKESPGSCRGFHTSLVVYIFTSLRLYVFSFQPTPRRANVFATSKNPHQTFQPTPLRANNQRSNTEYYTELFRFVKSGENHFSNGPLVIELRTYQYRG